MATLARPLLCLLGKQGCIVGPSLRYAQTMVQIPQKLKDKYYPKIGNRDIVGYGLNGGPTYFDRADFPFPGVRYMENTGQVVVLREKELGDWKAISLADKKTLYRSNFRQTFAEFQADNLFASGEWKWCLGIIFGGVAVSCWMWIGLKAFVQPEMPPQISRLWQEKQLENAIRSRAGPVEGLASLWDYENNKWKK